ncbi:LysE family transporter [Bradyrhizobium sp. CSA112]|uniref:LysE family translocator n=1 Tax=Bradyrhizobium sp. CSA112 TaxID=2699170 RepID=UPI0023AF329E|nr:LysE family transporter [Bradyrhizobium sp. CSA112]MDE5455373.1 LysE family transporter [Bradyrhizobium sp. CSA112]
MQELVTLASIVAALAVGVVSPGPSFVMVARVAVASTRSRALASALGMGAGGAVFGAAALLGLQSVLLAVPALYAGLKIVGGLYLCYLGYLIFRSAQQPLATAGADGRSSPQDKYPGSRGTLRAFWLGVTTQISNPKAAIIYASVFAAFLPASFSMGFAAVLLAAVFLVEAAWYALVALLFSSSGPQRAYLSCKSWVDRAAGAVMLGLGLKLVTSAAKP